MKRMRAMTTAVAGAAALSLALDASGLAGFSAQASAYERLAGSLTALGPATLCLSPAIPCSSATPDVAPPPSGIPMPTGDRPGWRQVFADDFSGRAVDRDKWGLYAGQPGSDPGSQWSPSHVVVAGGVLRLETYRDPAHGGKWTSGGINNAKSSPLKAGKYEIRMRADRASGINVVGLLWPKSNSWPPEIDFVEDRDGDRSDYEATLHYRNQDGKHAMVHRPAKVVDMSEWHTYGVEWGKGRLVYTLDGQAWATIERPYVPEVLMGMAVQSNAVTKGRVLAGPGTPPLSSVELDWVVGYVAG